MIIVAYQGSKRKEVNHIKDYEPTSIDTFVDVFGGGANVSLFYLGRNINTIYNDVSIDMVRLLNILKNKTQTKELIEEYNKIKDDNCVKLFYDIYDNVVILSPACKFLYLSSCCFRSIITMRTPILRKPDNHIGKCKSIDYFIKFNDIFKDLEVFNDDYKITLERYKDCYDFFLYLDPPYVSKNTKDYVKEFTINDLEYIKAFMLSCKCNVMLHIDFTGWTYFQFKDMIKSVYPVRYSMSNKKAEVKDIYCKYHCIITNY